MEKTRCELFLNGGVFRIVQSIPSKKAFEEQTGKKVVSSLNMKQYLESQQAKIDFDEDEQ